jgi:hypothetical protein
LCFQEESKGNSDVEELKEKEGTNGDDGSWRRNNNFRERKNNRRGM